MIYEFKKDKHRPKGFLKWLMFAKPFRFHAKEIDEVLIEYKFDKSCIKLRPSESGKNKLFGFTYGFHGEHTIGRLFPRLCNSLRIDWQPTHIDDRIMMYVTTDVNGKEVISGGFGHIAGTKGTIHIKKFVQNSHTYIVTIDDTLRTAVVVGRSTMMGYFLSPYFGGKSKTPNAMKLELNIKILKYVE